MDILEPLYYKERPASFIAQYPEGYNPYRYIHYNGLSRKLTIVSGQVQ